VILGVWMSMCVSGVAVVNPIIVIILTMFCIAKLLPFYSCRHV